MAAAETLVSPVAAAIVRSPAAAKMVQLLAAAEMLGGRGEGPTACGRGTNCVARGRRGKVWVTRDNGDAMRRTLSVAADETIGSLVAAEINGSLVAVETLGSLVATESILCRSRSQRQLVRGSFMAKEALGTQQRDCLGCIWTN